MAETLPPLTIDDIRGPLKNPTFSVYIYIGEKDEEGWESAEMAFKYRTRLRIYLVHDAGLVAEWTKQEDAKGIVFGWDEKPKRILNKSEADDLKTVLKAIREARKWEESKV